MGEEAVLQEIYGEGYKMEKEVEIVDAGENAKHENMKDTIMEVDDNGMDPEKEAEDVSATQELEPETIDADQHSEASKSHGNVVEAIDLYDVDKDVVDSSHYDDVDTVDFTQLDEAASQFQDYRLVSLDQRGELAKETFKLLKEGNIDFYNQTWDEVALCLK
jgi:hypothetical protein